VNPEAIIWTEGKTDWQHLKHAFQKLGAGSRFQFEEFTGDWGDDRLFNQCVALSRVPQTRPTIFIFDRDNDALLPKIDDPALGYRAWGNKVYSLAIPVPGHRQHETAISIEFYYSDDELRTLDRNGRRLYLSSEFDPASGRHRTEPQLSIGNKHRLSGKGVPVRIVDSDVYDEQSRNRALSKADFAANIAADVEPFDHFGVDSFQLILIAVELIVEEAREIVDLPFNALPSFLAAENERDGPAALASVTAAAIRACKLFLMTFVGATIRHYEQRLSDPKAADAKKVKPLKQVLDDHFTQPTLSILHKLARHCYHLIDADAPSTLTTLRSALAATPVLGPVGDLFDDLELLVAPSRHVRIFNKRQLPKPVLEYVIAEFAKYEGRLSETDTSTAAGFADGDSKKWRDALLMLVDWFGILRSLTFCLRTVERVVTNSDDFTVRLSTFHSGRKQIASVIETRGDLTEDRLETTALVLPSTDGGVALDLFPFVAIADDRLHFYNRTRAAGYEYTAPFSNDGPLIPTKRKFNHAALRAALGMQGLFWTQVAPTTSPAGVKANIPFEGRIIGRRQQLAMIMDEIINIPNQNGIIYGPGGVGKTALLIELSRQLYENPESSELYFQNIIWVSAKRDYYEPSINEIERREPQFTSLDNVLAAILQFDGWEDAESYSFAQKIDFVLGILEKSPTLLVLDNFESVPRVEQDEIIHFVGIDAKRALRHKPDHLKVLVTSREVIPSGFHQVKLKGLDKRDSKRLMASLYETYVNSGQEQLRDDQRDQLHEVTLGIPLLIKHCYAQIYEFGCSPDGVFSNLLNTPSRVIDFSFAEIFKLLKQDDLLLRTILLLEVSGRALMQRQMADILAVDEERIAESLRRLLNLQCVNRASVGLDDKYVLNVEARFLAKRLTQEHAALATAIKRDIAGLAPEKRLDYTQEESQAILVFQDYVAQGHYVLADDHIREELKRRPNSVLLNLHYAMYLYEVKRRTADAIELLERIRVPSGNDQQVLRLLMEYNSTLPEPNFEQASIYARELEDLAAVSGDIKFELARFYVHWSTAIKTMRFEIDPIKEILRQQSYKEKAEHAIELLAALGLDTHEWNQLLAQSYYNIWDYGSALRYVEAAIAELPQGSHRSAPYRRLRSEILKHLSPPRRGEEWDATG
jgi:DNA polymerase III delta prime subunit